MRFGTKRILGALGIAAIAGALLGGGSAVADQPNNPSFESGSTSEWTRVLSGGGIDVVTGQGPAGTGHYTARITAGDPYEQVQLRQDVYLDIGESIGGWARFVDADCYIGVVDYGGVTIVQPGGAETQVYFQTSCNGLLPWSPWSYTATAAGTHTIVGYVVNDFDGGLPSQILLDADAAGPHWEYAMKRGGGNVYSPYLPDYYAGSWSTKNVTLYLFCVAGDTGAPIDLVRADRAVTFKEGTHTYATKPTDECIDEDGLAAEPLVDIGPIMVDTKAPTCVFTPATAFIPRNTQGLAVFGLQVSDATSGFYFISGGTTTAGGAFVNDVYLDAPLPTSLTIDVTMPGSTAAKAEWIGYVMDVAGNTTNCKATVKAK